MDGAGASLTRRGLLRGTAALVAARGVYGVLDGLKTPERAEAAANVSRFQEQYLIDRLEVVLDNGVTAVIPPIHNDVITAKLAIAPTGDAAMKSALKTAQSRLEAALARVESPYPGTAAGLTIVVAWGLPYFKTYVPGPWGTKAPKEGGGSTRLAVLDAVAFPSDPLDVVLEDNHVAFKIRSDSPAILSSVESQLFSDKSSRAYVGDLFTLTSKRTGFVGRGFGTTSAAKALAQAAGVPGWQSIPDNAQLMLGFTSTQTAAAGPDNIPSFETLKGATDQFPSGYFAHGCAMHLSHLKLGILDDTGQNPSLERWYGKTYQQRVQSMMSPTTDAPAGQPVTFPNGPAQVTNLDQVKADALGKKAGHNSLLQTATRLGVDTIDNYGRFRAKGTAVPAREDFNTLDDPFTWYVDKSGTLQTPATKQPGLHFAVFVPTSGKFHAARMAMDGILPDGTDLSQPPYNLSPSALGINSVMHATHRQNLLVPPRAHRSFPLAELL